MRHALLSKDSIDYHIVLKTVINPYTQLTCILVLVILKQYEQKQSLFSDLNYNHIEFIQNWPCILFVCTL